MTTKTEYSGLPALEVLKHFAQIHSEEIDTEAGNAAAAISEILSHLEKLSHLKALEYDEKYGSLLA